MSNVITTETLAKIAISKNLIKEYKTSESERTVYLDNGTEFQIYLKNPYQTHLGVKIYVNDKSIGNMLVLRPGQSTWLDRFVDNDSRLLFSTYEVENSNEMKYATAKNGKVRVEFYHEKEQRSAGVYASSNDDWDRYLHNNLHYSTLKEAPYTFNTLPYTFNTCGSVTSLGECSLLADDVTFTASDIITCSDAITASNGAVNKSASFSVDSTKLKSFSRRSEIDKSATAQLRKQGTMETGRVEKGSKSDQKFESCDIDFEYSAFQTEQIQILPRSRKQVHVEDTRRKYCSQCGSKVSPKDKFCSNCGARLK